MRDTIEMARAIWESGTGIYEGPNIGQLKAFEALVRADERNRVWSQNHWTEYEQAIVQAEREAFAPILEAAQGVLDWTEAAHRPPVKVDEFEIGRMVRVRLHALIDLDAAIRERSANERARGQRSDEDSKRGETK